MLYQINGLPKDWALCPPHVANWIKQIKAVGKKIENVIYFKIETLKEILRKEHKVPDVADFLEKNVRDEEVAFNEADCKEL